MTKLGLLATAVLLALTATAFAASYTSGTYSAGRPGVHTTGVAMIVSQGSFAVKKASVVERCVAGTDAFTDHYHWLSGAALSSERHHQRQRQVFRQVVLAGSARQSQRLGQRLSGECHGHREEHLSAD